MNVGRINLNLDVDHALDETTRTKYLYFLAYEIWQHEITEYSFAVLRGEGRKGTQTTTNEQPECANVRQIDALW